MKSYIIVIREGEEEWDAILSTRKTFPTREAAREYTKGYAQCWQDKALIVECPKGLTYES